MQPSTCWLKSDPRFLALCSVATVALALCPLINDAQLSAQSSATSESWSLTGDAVVTDDGIIKIDTGQAVSNAKPFQDGVVEFEFQPSGGRSFVYLQFRVNDSSSREEIYFRPHKSNLPDALQYSPVIAGVSQWQLFWGAGGTTAVAMPAESWIKVRVEFRGRGLAVFVGADERPAMVIPRMATEPTAGTVALRSFIPAGSEAPFGARFRNFRVSPGSTANTKTAFDFSSVEQVAADLDAIRDWKAVPAFGTETKTVAELPRVDEATWTTQPTEPNGAVLLHRMGRAPGARMNATVVKLEITSDRDQIRALDLGFSDAASVFLNGKPLGSIDASYSFQRPQIQGLMGLHQSRWHLPLVRGKNELRVVVADSFGGWGLIGRWVE